MKLYQIQRKLRFRVPIEQTWDFFASPANLKKITPGYMDFRVRNELPHKMYAGMLIEYQVRPILNIPMTWVTEITQLSEPYFFIDEQRMGPYVFWHHQHHFKSINGGTEVTDIVHYRLPLGILGRIAHGLFIKSQLNAIFDYRSQALNRLMPEISCQEKRTYGCPN